MPARKKSLASLIKAKEMITMVAALSTIAAIPALPFTWFNWQWNGHAHWEKYRYLAVVFWANLLVPIGLWFIRRILVEEIRERKK